MKRKAQSTEFKPPHPREFTGGNQESTESATSAETTEPRPVECDQSKQHRLERSKEESVHSNEQDIVSGPSRTLLDMEQSNVNTMETEESNSYTKIETQDKSDLEDAIIEHQLDKVDSETKMISSPEPQTSQVAQSSSNLPSTEHPSDGTEEEPLCEEVKEPKNEHPQSIPATVDNGSSAETEIVEPPARKRIKRRMGMCGLGDRKRRIHIGGETFRQVPIGRAKEEGAEAARKGGVDVQQSSPEDGTLVTGLETTLGEEKRELDDAGTLGETRTENRSDVINNTTQENDSYMMIESEGTSGEAHAEDTDVLKDDTLEKNGSSEVDVKSNGSSLMDDEEAIGKAYKGNENISEENNEGGIEPALEEHGEEPISDTVEENQGSAVVDDERTTEDPFKQNENILKLNTLEEYGGSNLMVEGTMEEHQTDKENSSAVMNDRGKLEKLPKDIVLDEKNVVPFEIDSEQVAKNGSTLMGNDESVEEPGAGLENKGSVLTDTEGTLEEDGDAFKKDEGTTRQVVLDQDCKLADQSEGMVQAPLSPIVEHHLIRVRDGPSVRNDQEPKFFAELDAGDKLIDDTTEVTKEEPEEELSKEERGVPTKDACRSPVQVLQEVHLGCPEVLLALEEVKTVDDQSPPSSVAHKVSHDPELNKLSEQTEDRQDRDETAPAQLIGEKRSAEDYQKGAELPEAPTMPGPEDDELAREGLNRTEELRVATGPASGLEDDMHLGDPTPTPDPGGLVYGPDSSAVLPLHSVSDSQLHDIAASMEMEDRFFHEGFEEQEDATELVRGLVGELSSLNRTVMAAHRETELLRRGNRLPKPQIRRSAAPRHAEM
ncbi:uncharacterized protein LOC134329453 [Trichomycterus rosablanca]|uniref:uncharacterized protein LOC134329453 n=1 Tax=Trichomycterus rosablanca TaxID=2290929 RepID=UPI002F3520A4